jgi:hypothetical protein
MWIKRFVGVALLSVGLIAASAVPATAESPTRTTFSSSGCSNESANEQTCSSYSQTTKSSGAVCTRRCIGVFAPLTLPNSIEDYTLQTKARGELTTQIDGAVVSESKLQTSYNIRVRDGEVQVLTSKVRITEDDCRYTTRLVIANNVVRSDVTDEPCL